MKICVAQTKPIKGNILANIGSHKKIISLASKSKSNAIFFPELSLTGYEPELAFELGTDQNDKRLDDFQIISDSYKITIGVGLPIKTKTGIQIGMVIFQPLTYRQTYSKQYLHADEIPFFEGRTEQTILKIKNIKIAPAICYESLKSEHVEVANSLGAEIYVASVAKSKKGINQAITHYSQIASKYAMPVLMSNCIGKCDNFESIGNSAIWSKNGILLDQLDAENEGILIYDTKTELASKFLI